MMSRWISSDLASYARVTDKDLRGRVGLGDKAGVGVMIGGAFANVAGAVHGFGRHRDWSDEQRSHRRGEGVFQPEWAWLHRGN